MQLNVGIELHFNLLCLISIQLRDLLSRFIHSEYIEITELSDSELNQTLDKTIWRDCDDPNLKHAIL